MADGIAAAKQNGVLGWIERSGNKLPDPVFLFFWLIAVLIVISITIFMKLVDRWMNPRY